MEPGLDGLGVKAGPHAHDNSTYGHMPKGPRVSPQKPLDLPGEDQDSGDCNVPLGSQELRCLKHLDVPTR